MKNRLWIFLALMVLWAAAISARLYQVQVADHESYLERATEQQQRVVELVPPRGTIFDAQGRKLAVSVAVDSAYVRPHEIEDVGKVATLLAPVLDLRKSDLTERLSSNRRWLWLKRQLDPPVALEVRELGIEGVGFVRENKRFYPLEGSAGPVLGFVGTDHTGLAGIEAAYDKLVSGTPVRKRLLKDALDGRVVEPGFSFVDAEPGSDLHLTIDSTIQFIVEDELTKALRKSKSKQGVAVLMDPATGAILAMASAPTFDPNRFSDYPPERWSNLAIQFAYEPGSTFKAVTAVAALERNLIDPMDVIYCEEGSITLERTRIRDHKSFGDLTFREVITKSSNVGAIKTGLLVDRRDFYGSTRSFGFGVRTGIDLPGESEGILRPVERWSRHEPAYLSIGQGLSVTPLQLVRAFAALANGGHLVEPHVVAATEHAGRLESIEPEAVAQPIASAATLRTMSRLLEGVVEDGTGTAAAVDGYRVAGKTGTAQKALPGQGYSPDRHIASFVGFAPSRQPAVVGVVVLDEPRGHYHGGEVAAPVFAAILARVLPYLGAVPSGSGSTSSDAGLIAEVTGQGALTARPVAARDSGLEVVPDLQGLTARQAIKSLAERGLQPRLHGSGFVSAQKPPAGLSVESADGVVHLWLEEYAS